MPLLLKNEEIKGLLSMEELISGLENAFIEAAEGKSINRPRSRIHAPISKTHFFWFNNIFGYADGIKSLALRIDASMADYPEKGGVRRMEFHGDSLGLVLLFDATVSGGLKAIMDDHYLSVMRVGATTAVAANYLLPDRVAKLALLGAGAHARTQLEGYAAIRPIDRVEVYSPTAERLQQFCREMRQSLDLEVVPVASADDAVAHAEVIACATNAVNPVFRRQTLEENCLVSTIVAGDAHVWREELEPEVYLSSDLIVTNSVEQVILDRMGHLYTFLKEKKIEPERVVDIGSFLLRRDEWCRRKLRRVVIKNNTGMGIQFAVAAHQVYRKAKERGIGREIPDEWFLIRRKPGETFSP